MHKMNFNIYLL